MSRSDGEYDENCNGDESIKNPALSVENADEGASRRRGKYASGFDFWHNALGGAIHVVAPMVEQSELAWRLLCRRYGSQLCYTPMMHANVFARDATYRKENFQTCDEDRPLIAQFCANDPQTLLDAALKVQPYVDAVDINLGCPQTIAKKGHYGAFLQDEWTLIAGMVDILHRNLDIPVTCKIRVFENDPERTIRYAKMMEDAGCALLTIHGRFREQKGMLTGIADWDIIRRVKENLSIPVYANGNIEYFDDVQRCIKATGVDGVMSAEGNLHNPAIFQEGDYKNYEMAEEYLDIVKQYPASKSCVRGHLFKIFHHSLVIHQDLRTTLGVCDSHEDFEKFVEEIKLRIKVDEDRVGVGLDELNRNPPVPLRYPHFICQPYRRPAAAAINRKELHKVERDDETHLQRKRLRETAEEQLQKDGRKVSKNKLKKLMRNPQKKFEPKKTKFPQCPTCKNPSGMNCAHKLCRTCCGKLPAEEKNSCVAHSKEKKKFGTPSLCDTDSASSEGEKVT